jgi:hypothetical protein
VRISHTVTAPWLSLYGGPLLIALVILVLALLGTVIWLIIKLRRLEVHYRALTTGADGENLAEILESHTQRVGAAVERTGELDTLARQLERDGRRHVQRVGFLRFNPFRDAGGDQSFALALADEAGNGVVLSSLHGRDGSRVYGKPLATWESPYPLTDEEKMVITQARSSTP